MILCRPKYVYSIIPALIFLLMSILLSVFLYPIKHDSKALMFIFLLFCMFCIFLLLSTYKIRTNNECISIIFCGLKKVIYYNSIYELIISNKSYVSGNSYINIRYYKDNKNINTGLLIISNHVINFENLISEINNRSVNAKIIHE